MATVYIAPTAQGSANGTSAANAYAYSSLSTAESDAGSGGTIYFLDGDYTSSSFSFTESGVNYQSLNKHGARLGPAASGSTGSSLSTVGSTTSTNISIKNFIIRNTRISYNSSSDSNSPTVIQGNLIKMDEAKDLQNDGALYSPSSSSQLRFYDNVFEFIQGGRSSDVLSRGISSNAEFERNTLYFSTANTIDTSTLTPSVLKNSIFVGTGGGTFNGSFTSGSSNCCFHDIGSSNTSGGTNNVFSDPLFVDPGNSDFRLRPSSPCINAGTAS